MFQVITICKRPDRTYPFFFHTALWQTEAWQERISQVRQQYPGYEEEERLSEDELTMTKINTFPDQESAEEIIKYNLTHFPEMYNRGAYAKSKGHFFIQNPMFDREIGKFIIE